MPLYVYKCPKCNAERSDIRCVADRHDAPRCDCGEKMVLQLGATPGIVKDPAVPRSSL